MKRALLCIVSFGMVFLIFIRLSIEIKAIMAEPTEKIPVFKDVEASEFTDSDVEDILISLPTSIVLPIAIEGTSLIAERIASYDGPYLEDGSDHEVINVMALVLRNIGNVGIDKAEVVLYRDAQQFVFEADTIPPGATILVLEKNRALYDRRSFKDCSGWQKTERCDWSNSGITLKEVAIGTLEITNQTDRQMERIRLDYKTWLEGIYIGGCTFKHMIDILQPGETLLVFPEHYAAGYSKVIRVTAET